MTSARKENGGAQPSAALFSQENRQGAKATYSPDLGPCLGAKLALIYRDHLLTYLRDARADLPWAGYWDLPGGGREGAESATDCVLRETFEEFGLSLAPERLIYSKSYLRKDPTTGAPCHTVFFLGRLSAREIAAIRFGDEGQYWRIMPVAEFLTHPRAAPHFKERLRAALQDSGSTL